MVGFTECDELRLPRLRLIALSPVLKCHLERDFYGRRAIAGKENVLEISRCNIRQPFCQPDGRVASHPERRAVSNAIELLTNRRVDTRVVVAVDIAPHAARAIEILATIDVNQPASFSALDDQRLVFRHLREGVPMMPKVPITEVVASGRIIHS